MCIVKYLSYVCDEYNVFNLFLLIYFYISVFMIFRFIEILYVYLYVYWCSENLVFFLVWDFFFYRIKSLS